MKPKAYLLHWDDLGDELSECLTHSYYKDGTQCRHSPLYAIPDGWRLVPEAAVQKIEAANRATNSQAVEVLVAEAADLIAATPEPPDNACYATDRRITPPTYKKK